jgi:hypothetical protein
MCDAVVASNLRPYVSEATSRLNVTDSEQRVEQRKPCERRFRERGPPQSRLPLDILCERV